MSFGLQVINSDGSVQLDENTKTYWVVQSGTLAATGTAFGPASFFSGGYQAAGISYSTTITFPAQTNPPILVFNGARVAYRIASSTTATVVYQGGPLNYAVLSTDIIPAASGFGMQIMGADGSVKYNTDVKVFNIDGIVTSTNGNYYLVTSGVGPTRTSHVAGIDATFSATTMPAPPLGVRYSTANWFAFNPQYPDMYGYWSATEFGTNKACYASALGSYTNGNVVRGAIAVYNVYTGAAAYYQDCFTSPDHRILTGYINL
jgi:hypothetical protein